MKTLLSSFFLFFCISSFAQSHVPPDSAQYYEGSLATICGKVLGVYTAKAGMIKLEFGKPYPDESFVAIIFADDTSKFESSDYYKDKYLCVTGRIKLFKGRPEIILKDPNQLREE